MRIIARIDIKNNYVIKGINLEGLRKVGDPKNIIEKCQSLEIAFSIAFSLKDDLSEFILFAASNAEARPIYAFFL